MVWGRDRGPFLFGDILEFQDNWLKTFFFSLDHLDPLDKTMAHTRVGGSILEFYNLIPSTYSPMPVTIAICFTFYFLIESFQTRCFKSLALFFYEIVYDHPKVLCISLQTLQ